MSAALKRWGVRVAVAVLALLVLLAAAVVAGLVRAERLRERQVAVPVRAVALAEAPSPDALARGRHLYGSRGCADCHGVDGAGRLFIDEPGGLRVGGPQIAPGAKSATAAYRADDWVRAIRHGVAPSGRPLLVMPSEDYAGLSDEDLAALVAHVRQLPAVDGRPAVVAMPWPVRALYGLGWMRDAASKIDHARAPSPPVNPAATPEYGRYVAMSCFGCHGPSLEGGRIPGAPPDWPPAPRLVAGPGSVLTSYPDATALAAMFRSGQRPDGSAVRVMPFEALSQLDDVEVQALHRYLVSAGN